jgi:hypothetical protein
VGISQPLVRTSAAFQALPGDVATHLRAFGDWRERVNEHHDQGNERERARAA